MSTCRIIAALLALGAAPAAAETMQLQGSKGDRVTLELPERTGGAEAVALCLTVPRTASGPKGFDLGAGSQVMHVAPGGSGCRPAAPARQTLRLWGPSGPAIQGRLDLGGRGGGTVRMHWARD